MLPGSLHGDTLPGSYPTRESIATVLDEIENVAADIERNTRQQLVDDTRDVARVVEGIQANVIGSIGNELDTVARTVDKLQDKQISVIRNGLTGVYADLVRMGIPVPTMEQVQYANATGDFLGSMAPPTDDTAGSTGGQNRLLLPDPNAPINVSEGSTCPLGYRLAYNNEINRWQCVKIVPVPPTLDIFVPVSPDSDTLPPQDLSHYSPPPGEGDTSLWCPRSDSGQELQSRTVATALAAGWTGPIGPTIEQPNDISVRPTGWNGQSIWFNWVLPDYAGRCPVGLIGNGGTGTFFAACIAPPCVGEQPITQPPTQPPTIEPPPPTTIEQCRAVSAATCYTSPTFPDIPATVASDDYCKTLRDFSEGFIAAPSHFADFIAVKSAGSNESTIGRAVARALTGNDGPIIASTINSLGKWLQDAFNFVVKSVTCNRVALAPIATVHAIIKFLNQWFAVAPQAALQTMQQAENMTCQTKMPDQPSADKAYLSDVIDKDLWECWTKINGDVVAAAEKGLETLRTRPTSEQVSKLFRRKQLTKDEFETRMRQNGVLHDKDRDAIHNLTQDWPSLSDLTPWIVRDVFDETTIDWTEVDRLFEDKYTEESRKYFDAIGLTKDIVKYYWRAHFHLPSFTMASEMYHRFRNLPEGDPLRTDLKKVKALLIQDDWHPDWIERMLAITFRPMRLIDIRTAYDMRILDDEQLKEKLQILGYSDKDVETTFAQWQRRRDIRDAKQGGFPSVKQLIKQYANCEIDDHTFRYQLSFVVETPEQEQKAVEAAQIARESESNRRTIAGISYQYRRGLIDEGEANAALSQQGIDPGCIPSLVAQMRQRAQKQPKQVAAGSLCKMLEQGIINASEFVNALLRIGYTPIDADRIMRSCVVGLTQREMRAARTEAERLARERKAADKEAARLQRLRECGPPPCPKNRQTVGQNGAVDPSNPAS